MIATTQRRVLRPVQSDRKFFTPVRGRNRTKPSQVVNDVPPPQRLNAVEFCAWLSQADPGDVLEYHRGFLIVDRMPARKGHADTRSSQLDLLAKCAMRAAEYGLVLLVQRRNGPSDFSYLAVARKRPKKTPAIQSLALPEATQ